MEPKRHEIILILAMLLSIGIICVFPQGCAPTGEWTKHESYYLDVEHAKFSIYGYQDVEDFKTNLADMEKYLFNQWLEGNISTSQYFSYLNDQDDLRAMKFGELMVAWKGMENWWGDEISLR